MSPHICKPRRFAAASLLAVAVCCASRLPAIGQEAPTLGIVAPPFEITSVRQSPANSDPNSGQLGVRADGIHAENVPLHFMLAIAFNRQFGDDQIVGEPSWSTTDRFDAVGRLAEADFPKLKGLNRDQNVAMRAALVRQILTERFHLKTHIVEREGPVFALVVAKGGSKLKQVDENAPLEMTDANGEHIKGIGATLAVKSKVAGHVATMKQLVAGLTTAGQLDRPIVDKTGLTAKYDYALAWAPERASSPQENGANEVSSPSLFTAIQEQLGLKLEPAKGPIRTLVIDSVDRPAAN